MKTKRKTGSSGDTKEKLPERPVGSYSKYRSGRILRKLVPLFLSLSSFSCLTSSFPSLTNMQPSFNLLRSSVSLPLHAFLSPLFWLLLLRLLLHHYHFFFLSSLRFLLIPSSFSFILFVPSIYPFLLLRFRPFLPRPLHPFLYRVSQNMWVTFMGLIRNRKTMESSTLLLWNSTTLR